MRPIQPGWLRLAQRLQAVYLQRDAAQRGFPRNAWIEFSSRFDMLFSLRRQVDKAEAHGWRLASVRLSQRFASVLRAVDVSLSGLREQSQLITPVAPSLRDLMAELRQLDDEFGTVTIDTKRQFLSVRTDTIVLDRMNLGAFDLRLHWPRLAHRSEADCFEIVAEDESKASAANPDVTHPHVRDGQLCAGDAAVPLRRALGEGRLFDAFAMIRSVLENYNPHSAFVTLADWLGISCDSCGCRLGPDDRYVCNRCGRDVCEDCTSSCLCCGNTECETCQVHCGVCEAHWCARRLVVSARSSLRCCPNCLRTCSACGAKVAKSELDDESEQCDECVETADEANEPNPIPEGEDP